MYYNFVKILLFIIILLFALIYYDNEVGYDDGENNLGQKKKANIILK